MKVFFRTVKDELHEYFPLTTLVVMIIGGLFLSVVFISIFLVLSLVIHLIF